MGNTVKEQLGIDMDDKGLAETIDSITGTPMEQSYIHEMIGVLIFMDGGLLENDLVNPNKLIKKMVWDDEEIMGRMGYYASRSNSFMDRL